MAIRETDDLRGASSIGSLPSCRFHKTGFHCVVALLHSTPSERTPPPVAIIELIQHVSWFEYGWLIGGKMAIL